MVAEDEIRVAAIQETQYGEKAVLDSHYLTKDVIKNLPWKAYSEELDEHGSLRAKAESRGVNTKTSELTEFFDAVDQYGFSDEFATHVSWEPDALDGDGAWTIDREAASEAVDFWRFLGYTVTVEDDVTL